MHYPTYCPFMGGLYLYPAGHKQVPLEAVMNGLSQVQVDLLESE